ncbi:MAG: M1 family metallopeptidase [Chitinophagales bacterium]
MQKPSQQAITILVSYIFSLCLLLIYFEAQAFQMTPTALSKSSKTTQHQHQHIVKPNYKGSATKTMDLLHTRLDIHFDWEKQYVFGKATLQLKPYFYPSSTIQLDAKGFEFHQVAMLLDNGTIQALNYSYDTTNWVIDIDLGKTYTRSDTYTLFIDYTAKPDQLEANDSNITLDTKGFYFINPKGENTDVPVQLWTQGETLGSSCWFPTIDHPNERTTQEVYVTVADKYVTLSNGLKLSSKQNADGTRTDYWKQDIAHAPYLFALVVGEFAVVKDKWRDIELTYIVEPAYEEHAKAIFGATPEMIEFYSNKLGFDFPWEKYAQVVVRDFVAGAMENTTAVIYYDELNTTTRELLDGHHEDIIAHELIHHWFGDLVTCESWANLALNESFATYGEYLWFEHKHGKDYADHHINKDLAAYLNEAESKQVPIVRYEYEHPDQMFDRHAYQKGGRVLHLLRNYVGDEAFFLSIKKYLTTHAYQTVELDDLRQAFEAITGEDLTWFFNQWFSQPGHPILVIDTEYDDSKKMVQVHISQEQDPRVPFILPTAIDIYDASGNKQRHQVVIEEVEQTFSFPMDSPPALVDVDGDKVLLGELFQEKTIEQYAFQYQHAPSFLNRFHAIQELAKSKMSKNNTAMAALTAALDDPFKIIRQIAVERIPMQAKNGTSMALMKKMSQIASNDADSRVRNAALIRLGSSKTEDYLPIYTNAAAKDESYLVNGTALQLLYEQDLEQAYTAAQAVEPSANSTLLNIIARIYSEKGDANKQYFFEQRLIEAALFDRYALIDYYGDFLSRIGSQTLESGLATLQSIASKDTNWWVRLQAAQAIFQIKEDYRTQQKLMEKQNTVSDSKETRAALQQLSKQLLSISSLLESIKEQETDEKVLEYYENM